jgi:hypothetical protein
MYQIRCALRALNEAALLATIWNLRRATNIHGDIFVSNAIVSSGCARQLRVAGSRIILPHASWHCAGHALRSGLKL